MWHQYRALVSRWVTTPNGLHLANKKQMRKGTGMKEGMDTFLGLMESGYSNEKDHRFLEIKHIKPGSLC